MIETQFADLVVDGEQHDAAVLGTPTAPSSDPIPGASSPEPSPSDDAPIEAAAPELEEPEAAEAQDEPTRDESGKFTKKGKERYESKVGRLKAEAESAAAEREAERKARVDAERRAAELESRLAALHRQEVAAPDDPEPDFNSGRYDTYEAYVRDVAKWTYRQEAKAAAQQRAVEERSARWDQRVTEAKASRPDWDAVMAQGQSLVVTDDLRDAILESESGPVMVYHLIQHPEEFRQLVGLRGGALHKAIGKLEARVETVSSGLVRATPVVPPKPAPISPLGGGTAAAAESRSDPDEDSPVITVTKDWLTRENKKERERGRVR